MLNVLMVFLLLSGCLVAGLFLIGQYNAVVTIRHRIATVVLEIDFLLQQLGSELEGNALMTLDDKMMSELRGARMASHKAASNPFAQGALEALSKAQEMLMQACGVSGFMPMRDVQKYRLDQASLKLEGLVAHYRGMLGKNPISWIAGRMLEA